MAFSSANAIDTGDFTTATPDPKKGAVGITVDRNFKVVSAVLPDSPAAKAGIHAGDHLIAVDGYPTAKMRDFKEFAQRVSGAVGTTIDLELSEHGSNRHFHVKIPRVSATPPSQIPPGFDPHQVRSELPGPNQALERTVSRRDA